MSTIPIPDKPLPPKPYPENPVVGTSGAGNGVTGLSNTGVGVAGSSNAGGVGVSGSSTGYGAQPASDGVLGVGLNGVHGRSSATGVWGENTGSGVGVLGSSGTGDGVQGRSTKNGVHGISASPTDSGVWGENQGSGYGVAGSSVSWTGVIGTNGGGSGNRPQFGAGVWGDSDFGFGVYGASKTNPGVQGVSAGFDGVHGESQAAGHAGVFGSNTQSGDGVTGESANGVGVHGTATSGVGVEGESSSGPGVIGRTPNGNGVEGRSSGGGAGVLGVSTASDTGVGVRGSSAGAPVPPFQYQALSFVGVWGEVDSSRGGIADLGFGSQVGVFGDGGPKGIGVYGKGGRPDFPEALAGYFEGNCSIRDNLTKGGGGFRIDHPLEPAKKLFNHSFVESSARKNIYDGVAVLDDDGVAVVELPRWFQEINSDFCYQLTPIGAPTPRLHIAEEINENRFKIAGGSRGMKVSWQVTGIRIDPWARAHPMTVEEEKDASLQGRYLHAELYGQPEEESISPCIRRVGSSVL